MCRFRLTYFAACGHGDFYVFDWCKVEEEYQIMRSNYIKTVKPLPPLPGQTEWRSPTWWTPPRPTGVWVCHRVPPGTPHARPGKPADHLEYPVGPLAPRVTMSPNEEAVVELQLESTERKLGKVIEAINTLPAGQRGPHMPLVPPASGKENTSRKKKDSAVGFRVESSGSPVKTYRSLLPKPASPTKALPKDTSMPHQSSPSRKVKTVEPVLRTAERAVARERRKSVTSGTILADALAAPLEVESDTTEREAHVTPSRIPTIRLKGRRSTLVEKEKLTCPTTDNVCSPTSTYSETAQVVKPTFTSPHGIDAIASKVISLAINEEQSMKQAPCGPASIDDQVKTPMQAFKSSATTDEPEASLRASREKMGLADLPADECKQTVDEHIEQKPSVGVLLTSNGTVEGRALTRRASDIAADVLSRRTPSVHSTNSTIDSPITIRTVRSELRPTAAPFSPAASPSVAAATSTSKITNRSARYWLHRAWRSDRAYTNNTIPSPTEQKKSKKGKKGQKDTRVINPYWAWAPARALPPDHSNAAWTRPSSIQQAWSQPFPNQMVAPSRSGRSRHGPPFPGPLRVGSIGRVPYYVTQFEALSDRPYPQPLFASPVGPRKATYNGYPCNTIDEVEISPGWMPGYCGRCLPDKHMKYANGVPPTGRH